MNNTSSLTSSAAVLNALVKKQISAKYDNARIELQGDVAWLAPAPDAASLAEPSVQITFVSDNQRGEAWIRAVTSGRVHDGSVRFAAFRKAYVPVKRIAPGEAVGIESVRVEEVNIAQGHENQMRGLIVGPEVELNRMEARQTLLEGQAITSPGVQRMPDVRRGDLLVVQINSGGLKLSTQAVAQEPGHVGDKIRVMSRSTKRDMAGVLTQMDRVEVNL
ncbi:MAG: flagellar basal body P-ring formation chaperone FlgA [Bacteriovoracia bacterium]